MSVTVYIILAVVAAAIIATVARPHPPTAVRELLLAGQLSAEESDTSPSIEIICGDAEDTPGIKPGHLLLVRHGVTGICDNGAVSIAITIKGCDILIEERLTPGTGMAEPCLSATFRLGYMTPGYYHLRYNSVKATLWTAFTLHVRPGMVRCELLKR